VDDRSPGSELPDLDEVCGRLQRDATARAALVLDGGGRILGHSGALSSLAEPVLDAIADLVTQLARRGDEGDEDVVAAVGPLKVCAARLGGRGALAVVFDDASTLGLVRLRVKRARELLLRSLDAG
jgi:hypothetical protein